MQNPDRNGCDEEVDHRVDAVRDIENVDHRVAVSGVEAQAPTCNNKTAIVLNVSTSVSKLLWHFFREIP